MPAEGGARDALVESGWPTALSDAALLRAYQHTPGEPGAAEADALLAEIEGMSITRPQTGVTVTKTQ